MTARQSDLGCPSSSGTALINVHQYDYKAQVNQPTVQVLSSKSSRTQSPRASPMPSTGGNLALFRDNLVALVGPKNDSTTALVWHPIKYSEADTVLPFTQVNGSGELLDFISYARTAGVAAGAGV